MEIHMNRIRPRAERRSTWIRVVNANRQIVAVNRWDLHILHEFQVRKVLVPRQSELLRSGSNLLHRDVVSCRLPRKIRVVVVDDILIQAMDEIFVNGIEWSLGSHVAVCQL